MIPMPAEVREKFKGKLPGYPHVSVVPRDAHYRRVSAWQSTQYEITAFYTSMGLSLTALEEALLEFPGITMTTCINGYGFSNPDWPIRNYLSSGEFRPQVRGLWVWE